jgi:ketosteroid isomerase-like protein
MSNADDVLRAMCQSYSTAINASDSAMYSQLFTQDAIRMPPGANPECGPEQITKGEQADYDVAKWNVKFMPRDALPIAADWMYGVADVWSPMLIERPQTFGWRSRGSSRGNRLARR